MHTFVKILSWTIIVTSPIWIVVVFVLLAINYNKPAEAVWKKWVLAP